MKVPTLQKALQTMDDALVQLVILGPVMSISALAFGVLFSAGIFFTVWRTVVVLLAKVFKPSLGPAVPLRSATFRTGDAMYKSPTGTVVFYGVMEGEFELDRLKKVAKERIFQKVNPTNGKRFYKEGIRNMALWCGYPFWREIPEYSMDPSDEEMDRYISFYQDDPNGKTDFKVMKDFMNRYMYQPYSRTGPLFDVVIFPNYTPDPFTNNCVPPGGQYWACVWRLHHGLCDGYTGMKLFQALSTNVPQDRLVIPRGGNYTHAEKMKTASWPVVFYETLKLGPLFVYQMATLNYWQFTNSMGRGVWEWESVKGMNSTDVGLSNAEVREKRALMLKSNYGTTIPLSVVKEAKKGYGEEVSGTSILFAALVGAVKRTMYTKDWAVPPYLGVSFPLPLPGHDGRLRNHVTGMKVFLPMSEPDPAKRVYQIDNILKSCKNSTLPMFFSFFHLVGGTFPRWFFKIIPWLMRLDRSLTTSNLPGPSEPFDLAGYPIRDIGWAAGASVTLTVLFMSLFSFGGLLRVSFMGPGGLLGDQDKEREIITNFFAELEQIKARGPLLNAVVSKD